MKKALSIYPFVALLLAACVVPLPHAGIAAALTAASAYFFRIRHPFWKLLLALGQLLILPLLYEPLLHLFSPLLAMPLVPLIGYILRESALSHPPSCSSRRRELTPIARSIMVSLAVIVLASLMLGNRTLTITSSAALLFLATAATYVHMRLLSSPLKSKQKEARAIARSTSRVMLELKNTAKISLHIAFKTDHNWIHFDSATFFNIGGEVKCHLIFTPSLSGPWEPEIVACLSDTWGLIHTRQVLKPARIYIVPRARYAEWLARKYLKETAAEAGAIAPRFSPIATGKGPRGGVEYCNSRAYLPGDRMKDIDWKHTARKGEFVVKEFEEQSRKMAIIAINLVAQDAEEADDLVYNLVLSALTLAKEIIPCAMAAYSREEVVAATPFLNTRELVKEALRLGKEIVLLTPMDRYLQPTDIKQLRRSLRSLQEVNSVPARRLEKLLEIERRAVEEGSRIHPAREALTRVTARASLPARIVAISAWNHDSEALSLTLEYLDKRGYSSEVIKLKNRGKSIHEQVLLSAAELAEFASGEHPAT